MTTKEKIITLLLALLLAALITNCTIKDPQVILPGWSDTTLEFGQPHTLLILVSEGKPYLFWNTTPGWYTIPTPITNVLWCN